MTNLTGSVAWKDGKPLPHLHATAASSSFEAIGGHLLALAVRRSSMEIHVKVLPERLNGSPTHRLAPTSCTSVRPVDARAAALSHCSLTAWRGMERRIARPFGIHSREISTPRL